MSFKHAVFRCLKTTNRKQKNIYISLHFMYHKLVKIFNLNNTYKKCEIYENEFIKVHIATKRHRSQLK